MSTNDLPGVLAFVALAALLMAGERCFVRGMNRAFPVRREEEVFPSPSATPRDLSACGSEDTVME